MLHKKKATPKEWKAREFTLLQLVGYQVLHRNTLPPASSGHRLTSNQKIRYQLMSLLINDIIVKVVHVRHHYLSDCHLKNKLIFLEFYNNTIAVWTKRSRSCNHSYCPVAYNAKATWLPKPAANLRAYLQAYAPPLDKLRSPRYSSFSLKFGTGGTRCRNRTSTAVTSSKETPIGCEEQD